MNKDAESWAKVSAEAVCGGSKAQSVNVLKMALEDIQTQAEQIRTMRLLLRPNKPKREPRGSWSRFRGEPETTD